jgi:hypothetical protein
VEVLFTEDFIEQGLDVVTLPPVEMDINASVRRQQLADKDEPLPNEFDELRTGNFVLICLLVLCPEKVLL